MLLADDEPMIRSSGKTILERYGYHVLLADDVDAFAAACIEALSDAELRRSLADAAFARFDQRYRWGPIRDRLADLVREVAGR